MADPGWQIHLANDHASNFTHATAGTEQVFFDGETTRLAVSMKHRLARNTDIEFLLPFIRHSGGTLDGFIENWHDFFGLPQNGRDKWPRDQLRYFYEHDGVSQFDITTPVSGMGDAQLIVGYRLERAWFAAQRPLTVKASLKFPTGNAQKLTGSGAVALSGWLTGETATSWFQLPGLTYYHAGISWLQRGEVLAQQQRAWVMFAGLGSGVRLSGHIALQLQLDTHTSLYRDSQFNEINQTALLFTVGGNFTINPLWNLDIAVVEDLYVHTAPDVVFHLGLNGKF